VFLFWGDELFAVRAQKYGQGIDKYKNINRGERVQNRPVIKVTLAPNTLYYRLEC
jgi:hypothetical protein